MSLWPPSMLAANLHGQRSGALEELCLLQARALEVLGLRLPKLVLRLQKLSLQARVLEVLGLRLPEVLGLRLPKLVLRL